MGRGMDARIDTVRRWLGRWVDRVSGHAAGVDDESRTVSRRAAGGGQDIAENLKEGVDPIGTPVTKVCPRCAEDIKAGAEVCRYCGYQFVVQPQAPPIGRWIRTNSTVAISLATFMFVVFQLAKLAGFEVNTIVAILHAESLPAIVIGALVAQLPLFLLVLIVISCWWLLAAAKARHQQRNAPRSDPRIQRLSEESLNPLVPPRLLLLVLLFISFFTTPWPLFVLGLILAFASVLAGRPSRSPPIRSRLVPRILLGTGVVLLVVMLLRTSIWLPAENIDVTGQGYVVGYVVDEEGGWTTILTPTHRILRVETSSIQLREVCALESVESRLLDRPLRLRPAQLLSAIVRRQLPMPLIPPCTKSSV
jgi:hypothetical protein